MCLIMANLLKVFKIECPLDEDGKSYLPEIQYEAAGILGFVQLSSFEKCAHSTTSTIDLVLFLADLFLVVLLFVILLRTLWIAFDYHYTMVGIFKVWTDKLIICRFRMLIPVLLPRMFRKF